MSVQKEKNEKEKNALEWDDREDRLNRRLKWRKNRARRLEDNNRRTVKIFLRDSMFLSK